MSLGSLFFLLFFLPAFLAVYWPLLLAGRGRRGCWLALANAWLVAGSLVFYVFAARSAVLVLLVVAAVDFIAGLALAGGPAAAWRGHLTALDPTRSRSPGQKIVVGLALAADLGLLVACRYVPGSLVGLLSRAGAVPAATAVPDVLGTVGVSFFVFRSLSYTFEVYRGRFPATRNPLRYLAFVAFMPHLEAGPIARWGQLGPAMAGRRLTLAGAGAGVRRFIVGLGKKVLIANPLATLADPLFAAMPDQLTTPQAWLAMAAYTLQIYFDFAGYTDMAIGLGTMLGFEAPENFAHPYAARSVREFWQRWHMTLTSWLRDFVFLPLAYALDRKVQRLGWRARQADLLTYCLATLVTMALCGLWHGAAWTFGLWGIYHGLLLMVERLGWERLLRRAWSPLRHTWTLLAVAVGWVLFRAPSWQIALGIGKRLVGLGTPSVIPSPAVPLLPDTWLALALGIALSMPAATWLDTRLETWLAGGGRAASALRLAVEPARAVALAAVLLASLMALAAGAHRSFIYAGF